MTSSPNAGFSGARPFAPPSDQVGVDHYFRVILRRKFPFLAIFFVLLGVAAVYAYLQPNVYQSQTVILVNPQKVPESYVKPTVTGDIRNRLGTLSQQILSETRLQTIVESLNLYPKERKTLPREEVIAKMRKDISVGVVTDFTATPGGTKDQDLQAFRIGYKGSEPHLVAQVTNELASLFIEENLKAREQQAAGTAEFLSDQLDQTRKTLEDQEAKLRDFRLKHVGEMPDQQTADLEILGQLEAQLHLESDALNRAQQQKQLLQSMLSQSQAPVIDLDPAESGPVGKGNDTLAVKKARLAALKTKYSDNHPDVRKLSAEIAAEEKKLNASAATSANSGSSTAATSADNAAPATASGGNPVVQSQLSGLDEEIVKHKREVARISAEVASYQGKVQAMPVVQEQIADLERDYEISKAHYKELLSDELAAKSATELEIRQKGEKFSILDPAQPAERPSSPNRPLIVGIGAVIALMIATIAVVIGEVFSPSIAAPMELVSVAGPNLLEIIPEIRQRGAKWLPESSRT